MDGRRWLVVCAALELAACAYAVNPKLAKTKTGPGYTFENLGIGPRNSDDTFVVVTISGGGTRAAAFGYGVLRELARQRIGDGRSMLDETDVVSSVSGGSFAAAYLGLFGPTAFLEKFPDDVLHRKLELGILGRILLPWNWGRMLSPWFSRSDVAAAYYDDAIYQGRTFDQMPRRRPFIVMNATDVALGAQFSFTQDHFDRLCSDLDGVPVALGVTASSAFPVAFPPLTLSNYPKSTCGYRRPTWVDEQRRDRETNPPAYDLARSWISYESPKRKYVHLSDGGLADNIGLRPPYDAFSVEDVWGMRRRLNGAIKHLVVIVVDAKPRSDSCLDASARAPGFVTVLSAAATTPMENYSADSVELMRMLGDDWTKERKRFELRRTRCRQLCGPGRRAPGCDPTCVDVLKEDSPLRPLLPDVHVAHVRFDGMDDGPDKTRLQQIDTRLQLSDADVNVLVDWGARLLRRSTAYRDAIATLGGVPPNDD